MGIRILLAGEQEETEFLRESLERFWPEAECVIAMDCIGADWEKQAAEGFSLVFLDMRLAFQEEGRRVSYIRKQWPDCSIIFLTRYQEFDFLINHEDMQTSDYLLKPLSRTGIEMAVQKARERYQIRQEQQRAEKTGNSDEKPDKAVRMTDEAWRREVLAYLEAHLCESLTLNSTAGAFGTSGTYFCKHFKRVFQANFVTFVTKMRIDRAKELLRRTSFEVREIASQTGFGDAAYFTKIFRRETGRTPSEYRHEFYEEKI